MLIDVGVSPQWVAPSPRQAYGWPHPLGRSVGGPIPRQLLLDCVGKLIGHDELENEPGIIHSASLLLDLYFGFLP